MSGSKEQYVTLGPANGNYEHKTVPADEKDVPAFISDEFLSLGGIVNGILEGGAFPPYSIMPKRWREGMMIYFSQPVLPDITSDGIWLYRSGQWWKLVDDPSTIANLPTVYQLGPANGTAPGKPPTGPANPPASWEASPPEKNDKSEYIWASIAFSFDANGGAEYIWSDPAIWSAGVFDGDDGISSFTRYFAFTSTAPVIDDRSQNIPQTSGISWLTTIPDTTDENRFIWVTTTYGDSFGNIQADWSLPSLFTTPATTKSADSYAIGTETAFPPWDENAEGLPGIDWEYEPPTPATKDEYIWLSSRLEWFDPSDPNDGGKITTWSFPIRFSGISPGFTESRFLSSTLEPTIDDNTVRIPQTSGVNWETNVTPIDHDNDKDFVWITSATFTAGEDNLTNWSDPVKYSTPDTTFINRAWYLGSVWGETAPPIDINAPGIPPGWSDTQPTWTKAVPIWLTERLDWSNGVAQTQWSTPIAYNSQDGLQGVPGPPGGDQPVYITIEGIVWDDQAAYDATVTATGRNPIDYDIVGIVNLGAEAGDFIKEIRHYVGGSGNPGTWTVVPDVIDGSLVVEQSINGNSINALTNIRVGDLSPGGGDGVVVLDATGSGSGQARIWVGEFYDDGAFSADFVVDATGKMSCQNASVGGSLNSVNGIFNGTVAAGTFNGGQIHIGSAQGTAIANAVLDGGVIVGATVLDGGSGYVSAPVIYISGDGVGASATAVLSGDSVSSIIINSGGAGYTSASLLVAPSNVAPFQVDNAGNMIASSAILKDNLQIIGDGTQGGDIMFIGPVGNPIFRINGAGAMTCVNANLTGTISANAGNIANVRIPLGGDFLEVREDVNSGLGGIKVLGSGGVDEKAGIGSTGIPIGTNIPDSSGLTGNTVIWSGATPANSPFRVSDTGDFYANNGKFNGEILSEQLQGDITTAGSVEWATIYSSGEIAKYFPTIPASDYTIGDILFSYAINVKRTNSSGGDDEVANITVGIYVDNSLRKSFTFSASLFHEDSEVTIPCTGIFTEEAISLGSGSSVTIKTYVQMNGYGDNKAAEWKGSGYVSYVRK